MIKNGMLKLISYIDKSTMKISIIHSEHSLLLQCNNTIIIYKRQLVVVLKNCKQSTRQDSTKFIHRIYTEFEWI